MLPDYPETKKKLWDFYKKVMVRSHTHRLGLFGGIKSTFMHEGEMDLLVREDGTVAEIVPQTMQSQGVIPAESPDIENIKPNDIMRVFHEIGRGLADAKAKMILDSIEEATKKAGTQVGPHNDPAEQIFEMIERRSFDFGDDKRPIWGEVIVGDEETVKRLRATMERIDSTPELRERMELLIEQKRREFLDREAARKLVD